MNLYLRQVRFWDRREGAESLALVRILLGLVALADLCQIQYLGLVNALFAPIAQGGIGTGGADASALVFFRWLGHSAATAQGLVIVGMLSAATLCVGFFSRSSAFVLLFCWTEFAGASPGADRGIDTLLRNSLVVLACSGAGATWSVDAYRRHGRFATRTLVTAWPRFMLIAQLVVMYFWAGIQKQSAAWTSLGDYRALFVVLNEPHYARFALPHRWLSALYPMLQFATIATLIFERSAPLVPLAMWLRRTHGRGGLVRAVVIRGRLLEVWVGTGVVFHVALAVVAQLGIFPWGCLAMYPVFARPAVVKRDVARLLARARLVRNTPPTPPTGGPDQAGARRIDRMSTQ